MTPQFRADYHTCMDAIVHQQRLLELHPHVMESEEECQHIMQASDL